MSIDLTREPDDAPAWQLERCCFCASRTRFWYTPKDVAVCVACAADRDASEVPSKQDWISSPQSRGRLPVSQA